MKKTFKEEAKLLLGYLMQTSLHHDKIFSTQNLINFLERVINEVAPVHKAHLRSIWLNYCTQGNHNQYMHFEGFCNALNNILANIEKTPLYTYPPTSNNDVELEALVSKIDKAEAEQSIEHKYETLRKAVHDLYYSANWQADRPVNEGKLWEAVRDAAGFSVGESPKKQVVDSELFMSIEPIKLTAEHIFTSTIQPSLKVKEDYSITFFNDYGIVGKFDFNGPKLKFEGDLDESAELFVNHLCMLFEKRLDTERKKMEQVTNANVEKLKDLLRRLRDWDMLDTTSDGIYWRKEIKSALADESTLPSQKPTIWWSGLGDDPENFMSDSTRKNHILYGSHTYKEFPIPLFTFNPNCQTCRTKIVPTDDPLARKAWESYLNWISG
jgi:hypothetical protein